MIEGMTIVLYEKKKIGEDEFHHPIYEEIPVEVENVLVVPASSTDVVEGLNLYGKKAVYTIAIPKGDEHKWEDVIVEFGNNKNCRIPMQKSAIVRTEKPEM